ncbi:hypothetical protein ACW2AB_05950 [Limosilactobacillus fermentum]
MIGTLLAILFALKVIGALHCGWLPLIIAGVCYEGLRFWACIVKAMLEASD